MSFQYFGLLAFLVLFSGATFIVWKWPQGKHATLSQHVAVSKHKILYYILLFTIVLALLLPFFFYWFIPTFHVSAWFGAFVAVSSVAQYACTLIPEVGDWKTRWHRLLAGLSAASLVPALGVLFAVRTVPTMGKLLIAAGLAVMLSIIVLLLRGRGKHSHFLVLQFCYFGAFFIPILIIAYL
jgi:hypothetical protein